MKIYKGCLTVILCLLVVLSAGITGVAADTYDPADPENIYTAYIKDGLATDITASGKTQTELLDRKASELGISAERAYELELLAGLHKPMTDDEEPADSTEDEKPADTNRYYFYMPTLWSDSEYTLGAGIYWWEGTGAASSWPGFEATQSDVDNIYYCDVPKDVTNIIWNNLAVGGVDTPAEIGGNDLQTVSISTEYYEAGENDTYPDGVDSFDGMIFVVDLRDSGKALGKAAPFMGEWYYYYGNGEYGTAKNKADAHQVYTESYLQEPPVYNDDSNSIVIKPYIKGDADLDGKVTVKDATYIQKHVAGLVSLIPLERKAAGVDGDTLITVKDATAIQKYLAGFENVYGIGEKK